MAIRSKRPRTLYYLECDRCAIQSPAAFDEQGALQLARQAGWRIETRWNGFLHISTHTCPWCLQDERDRENDP